MRKLLCATAAVALAMPALAVGETYDGLQIQINGVMQDICTIQFVDGQTVSTSGIANGGINAFNIVADTAQVYFDFVVDNSTNPSVPTSSGAGVGIGAIDDISIGFTADFFCNGDYQATISTTNGALENADTVTNSTDFSNQLGYTLTATFATDGETDNPALQIIADGTDGQTSTTAPDFVDGSQHNGVVSFALTTGQSSVVGGAGNALIAGLYQEGITISMYQDGLSPSKTASWVSAPSVLTSAAFVAIP